MPFTKLAAVGDALKSALTTAVAAQSPTVPVYRGKDWLITSDVPADFLLVGHDGSREPGEGPPAGSEEQEPAGQGGGWRTARGTITCAVISQSGDTDMDARRARCEALLDLIDALLRVNPTLTGVVQFGWISSVAQFEEQRSEGSVARYVFGYHFEVDL